MLNWIYDIKVCQIRPNVTSRNLRLHQNSILIFQDWIKDEFKIIWPKSPIKLPNSPILSIKLLPSCFISIINQVISNNNFEKIKIIESFLSTRWLTVQIPSNKQEESFSKSKIFKRYSLFFIKILHSKFCYLIGRLSDSFVICFYPERWHHF